MRTQSRRVLLPGFVLLIAMLFSSDRSYAATTPITVIGFEFKPALIVIAPGDTVTWTNKDDVGHTVTFEDGSFDMSLAPNTTISRTFNQLGSFSYICTIHRGMFGRINVLQRQALLPLLIR